MADKDNIEGTMPQEPLTKQQKIAQVIEALRRGGNKLTDEELQKMQQTTDALTARVADDEDHDHSHPPPE
jgi:hypothetical protein